MTEYIDFVTFKNYLNKNNIYLFDSQYRIIHYRINNLNKLLEQTGGTNTNIKTNKPAKLLKKINNISLNNFIFALLDKNIQKMTWILEKYNIY